MTRPIFVGSCAWGVSHMTSASSGGLTAAPFLIAAAMLLAPRAGALAEDRVTVQPASAGSPITVVGEIEDFNGRRITIRVQSGVPLQSYPAEEVLNVSTYYTQQHREGMRALQAGDPGEARDLFDIALIREPRSWVQREIRAWLVRCALQQSDRVTAGLMFNEIVRSDAETRHWGVAPLIWAPEQVGDALRESARDWLTARFEPARLLGASVLLLDPVFGDVARTELDRLTRSANRNVVELARSQEWRLRLTGEELSPRELDNWTDRIERLPESLRAGPYYLLGRAFALRGELEQAAAGYLWVPLVYNDDPLLSARAALDAANALSRLGRGDEAQSLYGELVEKYAWSPFAEEARSQLETHAGG